MWWCCNLTQDGWKVIPRQIYLMDVRSPDLKKCSSWKIDVITTMAQSQCLRGRPYPDAQINIWNPKPVELAVEYGVKRSDLCSTGGPYWAMPSYPS